MACCLWKGRTGVSECLDDIFDPIQEWTPLPSFPPAWLVLEHDLDTKRMDVVTAYLYGLMDTTIDVRVPAGLTFEGNILQLAKDTSTLSIPVRATTAGADTSTLSMKKTLSRVRGEVT